MSRHDEIELASTPTDEPCAQVGESGYGEKARAECRAYRAQLLRLAAAAGKAVPEGVSLRTKSNAHDYGSYHEVVVRFPEDDEAAVDFAFWLENNQPERWDAEARAELGLPPVMPEGDADAVVSILLAEDLADASPTAPAGVYAAACPCCACTLVELSRSNGHPLAPLVWACVHCGFSMMGLAVPARPGPYAGAQFTCLAACEATTIRKGD